MNMSFEVLILKEVQGCRENPFSNSHDIKTWWYTINQVGKDLGDHHV